jgi:hypothetical protein
MPYNLILDFRNIKVLILALSACGHRYVITDTIVKQDQINKLCRIDEKAPAPVISNLFFVILESDRIALIDGYDLRKTYFKRSKDTAGLCQFLFNVLNHQNKLIASDANNLESFALNEELLGKLENTTVDSILSHYFTKNENRYYFDTIKSENDEKLSILFYLYSKHEFDVFFDDYSGFYYVKRRLDEGNG